MILAKQNQNAKNILLKTELLCAFDNWKIHAFNLNQTNALIILSYTSTCLPLVTNKSYGKNPLYLFSLLSQITITKYATTHLEQHKVYKSCLTGHTNLDKQSQVNYNPKITNNLGKMKARLEEKQTEVQPGQNIYASCKNSSLFHTLITDNKRYQLSFPSSLSFPPSSTTRIPSPSRPATASVPPCPPRTYSLNRCPPSSPITLSLIPFPSSTATRIPPPSRSAAAPTPPRLPRTYSPNRRPPPSPLTSPSSLSFPHSVTTRIPPPSRSAAASAPRVHHVHILRSGVHRRLQQMIYAAALIPDPHGAPRKRNKY